MPLYAVSASELRDHCKRAIEGLELWLRRLIDDKLSAAHGSNYVNATKPDGSRVIRSELARALSDRQSKDPKRYSRPIDAALLEEEIAIICNPDLYKLYFQDALAGVFPQGSDVARTYLQRLVAPRNALYHANPLSVHDAYRVLCYALDVVQGLKDYYLTINMGQLYNVPTVIRVTDSIGRSANLTASRPSGFAMVDYSNDPSAYLRCGDKLSIEVEIDPAFDPEEYEIRWSVSNVPAPQVYGPKFEILLTERFVSTRFCVVCHVTSNKTWHKAGTYDDQIDIAYRVLPPP